MDICFITETWLTSDDVVARSDITPDSYHLADFPRLNRIGGGLGIVYRSPLKLQIHKSGELNSFEFASCLIKHDQACISTHIIYRPPYSSAHPVSTAIFFEEFGEYLSEAVQTPHPILIVGDFNVHMNSNNTDSTKLCDLLSMYNLVQHVNVPTHRSGNTIDLMITRADQNASLAIPQQDYMLSDHMFIKSTLNLPRPPLEETTISYRPIKKINNTIFASDLLCAASDIMAVSDINEVAELYDSKLRHILDCHAPLLTKKIIARPKVPWFTPELKQLKSIRRASERIWLKTKTPENLAAFHQARNKFVNSLKSTRSRHYRDMISDAKGDPKKLFAIVNSLSGTKQPSPLPDRTSDQDLANVFGDYFIQKIETIRKDIGQSDNPAISVRTGLANACCSFVPVTQETVLALIKKSKTTSCALDPLPTHLLKEHKYMTRDKMAG